MHTSEERELSEFATYYVKQIESAYTVLANAQGNILDYVTAGAIIEIHEAVKKYVEKRFFSNKESKYNPWKAVAKKIEDKVEVFILFASTVNSDISYDSYLHLSKCRNAWAHSKEDKSTEECNTNAIINHQKEYIKIIKAIDKNLQTLTPTPSPPQ